MPNYTSGSYNAKLREIRDLYFKIGHVKCPCLNNKYVYFNQVGFRHLIRKGRIIRHIPDQLRRFALFRFATKIITSDKTKIVEMRQNRDILSCAMTRRQLFAEQYQLGQT